MALHPKPKFQSLLLLHLPPEILHIILDDETGNYKVARLSSATCRYLRTIAHPYIFKVNYVSSVPSVLTTHGHIKESETGTHELHGMAQIRRS